MVATKTYSRTDFDTFIKSQPYPPNSFQLNILESVAFGSGNLIVDAKAGSGKTSLLKMIASLLRDMGVSPSDVLFQAFNKGIEIELNEQLPSGFRAKTSHSLGFAMAREYAKQKGVRTGRISNKKYGDIAENITKKLLPDTEKGERFSTMRRVQNLIAMIMANDTNPHDRQAVSELADHYGIADVTEAMLNHMPDAIQQAITRFEQFGEMGFIDMIYMPVKLRLQPQRKLKYVCVDECQDLNTLQQAISAKMLHPEGRIILVGDPQQAIYAFAGADAESFKNLTSKFNATTLELNICYRCPTSHIQLAQSLVPTIEAAPNAIDGEIKYEHLDTIPNMNPGSMVICRLNAPLISAYFQFIAKEKPAVIIGRNMGKGLINIIERAAAVSRFQYRDMGKHLANYFKNEQNRLIQKPNSASKIAELSDSVDCLQVCLTNFDCNDLDCFKQKLEALFIESTDKSYDPKQVVTLCTVHRAKGLESDEIGIIYQRKAKDGEWNNIMPMSWQNQKDWEMEQEMNIIYVAFTRAKKTLRIFGGYKADEQPSLFDDFDDNDTLLTIETINPETSKADEKVPVITLTESNTAAITNKNSDDTDLSTEQNGEITVMPPSKIQETTAEVKPDTIPEEPQAWAKYVLEHKEKFVILDTETTDLPSRRDNFEIIQLSIIDMDGNTLYSEYIKPRQATISPGAAAIHGITDAKIAFAGFLGMEWSKIEPHIKGKHIIAYASPFDKGALENSLRLNHPSHVKKMDIILDWHCAMRMYAKHNPHKNPKRKRSNWKLIEALPQQRLTPSENAHDALADVLMTLELIKSMAADPENRWKNKQGFMLKDLVKARSSDAVFEVIGIETTGKVIVKSLEDNWQNTFLATQLTLVQPAHERIDKDVPIEEEPTIESKEIESDNKPITEVTPPTPSHKFNEGDFVKTRNGAIGIIKKIDGSGHYVKTRNGLKNHYAKYLKLVIFGPQQKPIDMSVPNAPKQENTYDKLEKLIHQFDSPEQAQEWFDVFQEIITTWKTEFTEN